MLQMQKVRKVVSSFSYNGKTIEYPLWYTIDPGQKPDVVILLGAGQVDMLPRMVAKRAGKGVVVIGGVPHWHAHPSGKDIEAFTLSYFESAYKRVLQIFSIASMHIIAESQAAPIALLLAINLPGKVQNVALIRPLGFSVKAYGATPEERFKTFKRRIAQTSLQHRQWPLYDPRNVVASLTLTRAMLREPTRTALNKKYTAGISYDSTQDLEQAAKLARKTGNSITIIVGGKDKMFPAKEVLATLKGLQIPHVTTVVLPRASHSPIAIRDTQEVLKSALTAARNK